jgi:ribosomal protein S12 methylthiotransferase accessory factor
MASGNCVEEALLHALCEVIERDAWSLAEVAPGCIPDLVYDGDDPLISQMLQLFSDAHVAISMKDITLSEPLLRWHKAGCHRFMKMRLILTRLW